MIDPKIWERGQEIVAAAIGLPKAKRETYIQEACAGQKGLEDFVHSVLHSGIPKTRFLKSMAPNPVTELDETGSLVGKYTLVKRLARGGMGTVYVGLRSDGEFEARVAVKLIKKGMDSEEILARFLRERQVLAEMNHKNIAKLLDGGSLADGRPYFVMEYIDGVPIDEYCQEMRLSVRESIELFLQVCDAIDYAHQNDVIHRDLKPNNILIAPDGTPRLLDFGVAKILRWTPEGKDSVSTVDTNCLPITPQYASPEQLFGVQVGKATDVYSLGLTLYKMLTGAEAFRFDPAHFKEFEKAVTEQEPIAPSNVRRALGKDLDYVLLKALRKAPGDRYVSVREFMEDLRRILRSEPVQAREGSKRYRVKKFFQHNLVKTGLSAILLGLVSAGLAVWKEMQFINRKQVALERVQRLLADFSEGLKNPHLERLGVPQDYHIGMMQDFYMDYLREPNDEVLGKLMGARELMESVPPQVKEMLDAKIMPVTETLKTYLKTTEEDNIRIPSLRYLTYGFLHQLEGKPKMEGRYRNAIEKYKAYSETEQFRPMKLARLENNFGAYLISIGKFEEAERYLLRTLPLLKDAKREHLYQDALKRTVDLYEKMGDEERKGVYQKLLEIHTGKG